MGKNIRFLISKKYWRNGHTMYNMTVLMKKMATQRYSQRNCRTVFIAYKDLGWLCQDSDEKCLTLSKQNFIAQLMRQFQRFITSTNPQYLGEASEETQARALLLLLRVANSDAQFYSQFFSREQDGVLACHRHANRASIFSRCEERSLLWWGEGTAWYTDCCNGMTAYKYGT
ncbi:uncharacterized protein LOC120348766 isoform X3 [Nilaparvata lugens]|uniref:uncharacterized protein LOC120348766 isoform X3 n=2 Tax=Nilaparvata lugens TaxID=108931 RepID=UPI00193E73F3|nr:uncharacterized protein LOC120348766 isoform X3 [Nilaparvata lugens]